MKENFDNIFRDATKHARKYKTSEYESHGVFPIIDQGKEIIAGFCSSSEGLFESVPAIIFGDHTRIIKYVDRPFFLGADGAKILIQKNKDHNCKYLYYALKNVKIPNTGYNRHYKWLKRSVVRITDRSNQDYIVSILDRLSSIIEQHHFQLRKLDELVKCRFVEMFGDPIINNKSWNKTLLSLIASVGSSKRIYEKEYVNQGVPFYRTKELVELSKGLKVSTELYISEDRFADIKRKYGVPSIGDLMISAVGTIGTIWVVNDNHNFYYKDGNIITVKGSNKYDSIFMKLLLETIIAYKKTQMSAGTAYSALTIDSLKKEKIIFPPLHIQKKFSSFVHQLDKSRFVIDTMG